MRLRWCASTRLSVCTFRCIADFIASLQVRTCMGLPHEMPYQVSWRGGRRTVEKHRSGRMLPPLTPPTCIARAANTDYPQHDDPDHLKVWPNRLSATPAVVALVKSAFDNQKSMDTVNSVGV